LALVTVADESGGSSWQRTGKTGLREELEEAIYLVVGAAVYGLIFLLLRYGGDGSGGGLY